MAAQHKMWFIWSIFCGVVFSFSAASSLNLNYDSKTMSEKFTSLTFPTIPTTTTVLYLRNHLITYIPAGALDNLDVLYRLDFVQNQLQVIGNLSGVADTLKELYLDTNTVLGDIPSATFTGFQVLERIFIANTGLTTFPVYPASVYATLQRLSIHSNQAFGGVIEAPHMAQFTALTHLYLQGMGLTQFPYDVGLLPSIQYLYLHSNPFTIIVAEDIPVFTTLINLEFNSAIVNQITCYTSSVQNLILNYVRLSKVPSIDGPEVTNLNLGNNKPILKTFNPSFFDSLPKLQTINVERNDIEIFPNFGAANHTLTNVYLQYNKLTTLPAWINLPLLRRLDVYNNMLESIDPDLDMPNLENFQLHANQIKSLHPRLYFPKVTSLTLENNQLQALPATMAKMFPSLSHLNLRRNQFTAVPIIGKSMSNLYLEFNQITSVKPTDFDPNWSLGHAYLRNNALTSVADVASGGVVKLYVENNPDVDICRCSHAWMRDATLKTTLYVYVNSVTCPGATWPYNNVNNTKEHLLEFCQPEEDVLDSAPAILLSLARTSNPSCAYPTQVYHANIVQHQCAKLCYLRADCASYKFRLLAGRGVQGECRLLAPINTAAVDVADPDDPSWGCYLVAAGSG